MKIAIAVCIYIATALVADTVRADSTAPLVLESKIALDHVHGRIDHLTADVARQRLYVAELGNDTVGVVDLKNRAVIGTLHGFHEPQGIGYQATTDTLYIANGGDGEVQLWARMLTTCESMRPHIGFWSAMGAARSPRAEPMVLELFHRPAQLAFG